MTFESNNQYRDHGVSQADSQSWPLTRCLKINRGPPHQQLTSEVRKSLSKNCSLYRVHQDLYSAKIDLEFPPRYLKSMGFPLSLSTCSESDSIKTAVCIVPKKVFLHIVPKFALTVDPLTQNQ